jgi:hypothetical protein
VIRQAFEYPMSDIQQFMHGLEVPIDAESVSSPTVQYGEEMKAIHFLTEGNQWGRVTFERLDSLKVSRGEHEPYPSAPAANDKFHWVTTVSNSAWLRERYDYEKRYYERSYRFNGNVNEMLTMYSVSTMNL